MQARNEVGYLLSLRKQGKGLTAGERIHQSPFPHCSGCEDVTDVLKLVKDKLLCPACLPDQQELKPMDARLKRMNELADKAYKDINFDVLLKFGLSKEEFSEYKELEKQEENEFRGY